MTERKTDFKMVLPLREQAPGHGMQLSQAQRELRERLFLEAAEAVKELTDDDNTLAAILTGSAAWGKPNPDGDLDIILITQNQAGAFYRYMLPTFCSVKRRTELGFIPYAQVTKSIQDGYRTRLGSEMLEQLKNGRVLFERDGAGENIIESCRAACPGAIVVGRSLGKIGSELDSLADLERDGPHRDTVLGTRRIAKLAARVLLLARDKTAVVKEKHELRAVRRQFSASYASTYESLMGMDGMTKEQAEATVRQAIALIQWVLKRHSVASDLAEYEMIDGQHPRSSS